MSNLAREGPAGVMAGAESWAGKFVTFSDGTQAVPIGVVPSGYYYYADASIPTAYNAGYATMGISGSLASLMASTVLIAGATGTKSQNASTAVAHALATQDTTIYVDSKPGAATAGAILARVRYYRLG